MIKEKRLTTLKKGQKVRDTWYKEWGVGKCIRTTKTLFYIKFADGEIRDFDKQHLEFLRLVK